MSNLDFAQFGNDRMQPQAVTDQATRQPLVDMANFGDVHSVFKSREQNDSSVITP